MIIPFASKKVAAIAASALSTIDYTVATRVSEDVASIVNWAYLNDQWWVAKTAITILKTFDDFGSFLIHTVVWFILNS